MNRSTSRSTLSSRRRGHVVVGLLTAGMIALAGQGTARAAEQPAESRTATVTASVSATATGAERGTGSGTVSAPGLNPLALLDLIGDLLPVPAPLPKNNNDWK
ncbi:hypothetical protein ABT116_22110 [Streptomyces sp. NPDC002130]|uniref:hypothetical protein n=1 Tax=Streptomyces sp. NPDC002130 TaxID=3155568 RepID=UPI00331E127B